ncbi:MAG: type III pantothenate kinase [Caldilineaceae bacterium]|nr:type III pantothenate kinase [Caldilineaceae bacterium]
MLLTVDIGNSSSVLGAFGDDDAPVAVWRLPTERRGRPETVRKALLRFWQENGLSAEEVEGAALCSVVASLTELWKGTLEDILGREPLVLHQRMELGMVLDVRNPDQVGMDRLADAAAVRARTRGAAVAVDFGTATTFNVVDEEGRFRGGAIAPGLATAAESLKVGAPGLAELSSVFGDFTPTSDEVELNPPSPAIGRDTDEALRSGIILGYAGLVEGLLARIRDELGSPVTVVSTGGLGHVITPRTGSIDYYDPWLTLAGIRTVYGLNAVSD